MVMVIFQKREKLKKIFFTSALCQVMSLKFSRPGDCKGAPAEWIGSAHLATEAPTKRTVEITPITLKTLFCFCIAVLLLLLMMMIFGQKWTGAQRIDKFHLFSYFCTNRLKLICRKMFGATGIFVFEKNDRDPSTLLNRWAYIFNNTSFQFTARPSKMMVGKRSFPFNMVHF